MDSVNSARIHLDLAARAKSRAEVEQIAQCVHSRPTRLECKMGQPHKAAHTYTRSFLVVLSSLRKQHELMSVNTGMNKMFQMDTNQLVKKGAL